MCYVVLIPAEESDIVLIPAEESHTLFLIEEGKSVPSSVVGIPSSVGGVYLFLSKQRLVASFSYFTDRKR